MELLKLSIIGFVVFIFAKEGFGLMCYSCTYCDHPEFWHIRTCSRDPLPAGRNWTCEKDVKIGPNRGVRIDRSCGINYHDQPCPPGVHWKDRSIDECYCNTDLCNKGLQNTANIFLTLAVIIVLYLNFLFY
ncbi:uncharacterized protein LOC120348224 [Styela clava]|uniref:uncharacterized protein LOC120348224 n=1 Tax=Styela clava TaxID=7725 RepID=UPI0019397047|nr:uncharacterized protein LOC120348224 [Styela clava]